MEGHRSAPGRRRGHGDLLHPATRAPADQRPADDHRLLAGAGLRNTELCRIDIRDVDFAHGTINVADAKTEAGVRKIDLSPMLRDKLLAWRASLAAPTPDSPFFPTRAGS